MVLDRVLQWDKTLGGTDNDYFYSVALDSSDNIIVCGYTKSDGAGGNDLLVAKYNSSGTLQWDRTLGGTGNDVGYGVAIDSSDNIIVCGITSSDGAGGNDALIAKYNSSGTIQFARTLGGSGTEYAYEVALDSNDNIYIVGSSSSTGTNGTDLLVAKISNSGAFQWDKILGGVGSEIGYGIAVDSSDNVIVGGYTTSDGAGGVDFLIAKYNSSGTLQWDKTLGGSVTELIWGMTLDSSDNILACGWTNSDGAGNADAIAVRLPADGSGGGTYGSYTYEDAVLTASNISLTWAVAVLTDAAAVLTAADAVLTDDPAVLTEELIEITP